MLRTLAALTLVGTVTQGGVSSMKPPPCQRLERSGIDWSGVTNQVSKPVSAMGVRLANTVKTSAPNLLLSPWSLYAVLAQLEAGARGATRNELRTTLYGDAKASYPESVADASASIGCTGNYTTTISHVANRIFLHPRVKLVAEYPTTLERLFGANVGVVDFSRADAAARQINEWVAQNTMQKIPALVNANQISAELRLVLANALYLKGSWLRQFPENATKPGTFHAPKGRDLTVPLMHVQGSDRDFEYAKLDGYEAVRLLFDDRQASMIVLLPATRDGLPALAKRLDAAALDALHRSLQARRVNLTLPRFKATGAYELAQPLQAMGLKAPFARGADFTGIDDGVNELFVNMILQRVVVDVNEKGFEGAAASAAMVVPGSAPPKPTTPVTVVVDRPFLFLVEHRVSGALLFYGAISDPTSS